MSNITMRIVTYAAQECSWQESGELSVACMISAWRYCHRFRNRPLTLSEILGIAKRVDPLQNTNGVRRVAVRVGMSFKMHSDLVPEALERLINNQPSIGDVEGAKEWFKAFEDPLHPFRDGNGRTGSLAFNRLAGSIDEPIHPPNYWNDDRRDYKRYPVPDIESLKGAKHG